MVDIQEVCDEAERIQEDSEYSAKSHFNAAASWARRHYLIGVPATVAGAAAGAAVLKDWPVIAGCLALATSALAGLLTFLKPSERAAEHRSAGGAFLALRNDARLFSRVQRGAIGDSAKIVEKLEGLNARRNQLNGTSPTVPRKAFETARKGIEAGESRYRTDQEKK